MACQTHSVRYGITNVLCFVLRLKIKDTNLTLERHLADHLVPTFIRTKRSIFTQNRSAHTAIDASFEIFTVQVNGVTTAGTQDNTQSTDNTQRDGSLAELEKDYQPIMNKLGETGNIRVERVNEKDITFLKLPTGDHALGGDAKFLYKNANNDLKKNMTHVTLSDKNVPRNKLMLDLNHYIIGVYEGKDTHFWLMSLLNSLIPILVDIDQNGIIVDGELYRIRFHFLGDLIFILNILGMKGVGTKWWCPKCRISGMDNWTECAQERHLANEAKALRELLDANKKFLNVYGRSNFPVSEHFDLVRYHFCSLHMTLAFGRGIFKGLLQKCILDERQEEFQKLEDIDAILLRYGKGLEDLILSDDSDQHEPNAEALVVFLTKCHIEHNPDLSDITQVRSRVQAFIQQTITAISLNSDNTIWDVTKVKTFQLQLKQKGINVKLTDMIGEKRKSLSMTADHVLELLKPDNVAYFSGILNLDQNEITVLHKLQKIIHTSMVLIPSVDDITYIIENVAVVVEQFISCFNIKPFYYCHLLVTHMKEQLRKYRSLAKFNCSSIE